MNGFLAGEGRRAFSCRAEAIACSNALSYSYLARRLKGAEEKLNVRVSGVKGTAALSKPHP